MISKACTEDGTFCLSKIWCFIVAVALFVISQADVYGQTFKAATFQSGSKTGGIQEAIDSAAKAGGGKVEIPAGTFILHADPARPAIVLRSRVTLLGAGQDKTILKLEANSKAQPAVMANEHYADPDAADPDHDITLNGFTIDVAAADQVLQETQLASGISLAGLQPIVLQSMEGVGVRSVLRVDPGPDEEIIPILGVSSGNLYAFFMHPHPAGAKVMQLVYRLYGLALVGTHNVTIQKVTF